MLKFFRRIRKNLISNGQLHKYLLYAVGEIFLIVLGILIALSLNNRNDVKLKKQKEIAHLEEIQANLKSDLEITILPGVYNLNESIQLFDSFYDELNDTSFNRNTQSVIDFLWNITNPQQIVLNTVGFDNLNSAGIDLISSNSLKTSITTLYGFHYKRLRQEFNIHYSNTRQRIWPFIQININYSHREISEEELKFLQTNGPLYSMLMGNTYDIAEILSYLQDLRPKIEDLILDIDYQIKKLS